MLGKKIDKCAFAVVFFKGGVWVWRAELTKSLKLVHVQPLFGFCKGVGVVLWGGCGKIGGVKTEICDLDERL